MQRERGEAADAGATDLAPGSADSSAPTEANFEAGVRSMTAEATASTEANGAAVGPVTRLDNAAPTGSNPEILLPCETVDAVAPREADAEQEVRFVTAVAAAPTGGPDAGSESARGGRRVVETPALGPTPWGLGGGGETPAIRPDPVAPSEPDSGSQIPFSMAEVVAPTELNAEASGPAAPTGPDAPKVGPAGSVGGTAPTEPKDDPDRGCRPPPASSPAEGPA